MYSAPCDEIDAMEPSLNNPIVASSGQNEVDKLRTDVSGRWNSNPEDTTPTLSITVAEFDSVVQTVLIEDTRNVRSVVVTVYDSNNLEVSQSCSHPIHLAV